MPRFCANVSLLFAELPFTERFAAAARAGFTGLECQFPYAWPAPVLAAARADAGLPMVLINLPAGDWAGGDRGIAALPDRVAEFRDGVERAIAYAQALGCPQCNALAGCPAPGTDPLVAERTLIDNLRFAAGRFATAGLRLLIEPINTHDVPGFFLRDSAQALRLIETVGADNLFLQLDFYHAYRMGEDIPATLRDALPRIGHLQVSDHPGRHEPGSGEIDCRGLFDRADALGYDGWIGAEYVPRTGTEAGLGWFHAERARGAR